MKNSVGTPFELEVKSIVERELTMGQLGITSTNTDVFHQKGYFSKERNSNIKMDVVLEVYTPSEYTAGERHPWMIWVWECKGGDNILDISEVEEFSTKLQQLGLHRTKGTVVCRVSKFSKTTINFARSRGIGLAVVDHGRIKNIVHFENGRRFSEERSLSNLAIRGFNKMAVAAVGASIDDESAAKFCQRILSSDYYDKLLVLSDCADSICHIIANSDQDVIRPKLRLLADQQIAIHHRSEN
jgi:hypothetical protein